MKIEITNKESEVLEAALKIMKADCKAGKPGVLPDDLEIIETLQAKLRTD